MAAMATEGVASFTIGTANCSGDGHRLPPDAATRFGLLKGILTGNDVVLIQEIQCKPLIQTLESTHHVDIPGNDTGIILKKEKFEAPETCMFYSKGHFDNEKQQVLKNDSNLQIGDFTVAVAKPLGWQKSILFVSYHGPSKHEDKLKPASAVKFMELCNKIKEKLKADYLIIGGDFNLPDETFLSNVLQPEPNGLSNFHVASDADREMRTKGRIDYFIHEDTLNMEHVTLDRISQEATQNNGIDYTDLSRFLDHDPVTATVSTKSHPRKHPVAKPCAAPKPRGPTATPSMAHRTISAAKESPRTKSAPTESTRTKSAAKEFTRTKSAAKEFTRTKSAPNNLMEQNLQPKGRVVTVQKPTGPVALRLHKAVRIHKGMRLWHQIESKRE